MLPDALIKRNRGETLVWAFDLFESFRSPSDDGLVVDLFVFAPYTYTNIYFSTFD